MSSFRIRPRFTQEVPYPPEETQQRLADALGKTTGQFELKRFPGFLCIRIHADERTFWSPRLNLSMEATGDNSTRIDGIYGPNANVWSAFLYAYLITGMLGLLSGIFGACQWYLNVRPPWGLWIFAAVLLVAMGLYVSAQFGQKLAARQMYTIHLACEQALGTLAELH